jgi:hypothetical protein
VGQDHDTATFAIESLRRWWQGDGALAYSGASQLLVCCDRGGSNGYRLRLWKYELGCFATETGLAVTVCHLPPGTSKWNKIEHRLFSHISTNWRGRPLTSHEVIGDLIGATTTKKGLKVHAERDQGFYPTSVNVLDKDLAGIPLRPHKFHGEWNYTTSPRWRCRVTAIRKCYSSEGPKPPSSCSMPPSSCGGQAAPSGSSIRVKSRSHRPRTGVCSGA